MQHADHAPACAHCSHLPPPCTHLLQGGLVSGRLESDSSLYQHISALDPLPASVTKGAAARQPRVAVDPAARVAGRPSSSTPMLLRAASASRAGAGAAQTSDMAAVASAPVPATAAMLTATAAPPTPAATPSTNSRARGLLLLLR
jgi:hypothetical protein